MNNKDFTYLVILTIIVLSSIISQKETINSYTQHPVFDLIMLLSIIVLSKVDSKNFQIVKDITQILYQLAVSAGVLVNI